MNKRIFFPGEVHKTNGACLFFFPGFNPEILSGANQITFKVYIEENLVPGQTCKFELREITDSGNLQNVLGNHQNVGELLNSALHTIAEAVVPGDADRFLSLDITSYCRQEQRIPCKLVLVSDGEGIKLWNRDSLYPFFSPHIEIKPAVAPPTDSLEEELQAIVDKIRPRGVIVYPPNVDWNSPLFQRPHQLLRAFARNGYLSFFVTPNILYDKYSTGFHSLENNLFIARAPMDVFSVIERPAVIINSPVSINHLLPLANPFVIFDYIDELQVFYMYDSRMEKTYRYLMKQADLVTVTAGTLLDRARVIREDSILCPNGVDFDHFACAFPKAEIVPRDLRRLTKKKRPVIGYYGAMAHWVDYPLLKYLARKKPDYQIVLIGSDYDGSLAKSGLLKYKNVVNLGPKDYTELPGYLAHFDVAVIPFVINDITRSTNPIKMYEYMAAGKPVVTTAMPECAKENGILIAAGKEDFVQKIKIALQLKDDLGFRESLVASASQNTWDIRAELIIRAIEEKTKTTSFA